MLALRDDGSEDDFSQESGGQSGYDSDDEAAWTDGDEELAAPHIQSSPNSTVTDESRPFTPPSQRYKPVTQALADDGSDYEAEPSWADVETSSYTRVKHLAKERILPTQPRTPINTTRYAPHHRLSAQGQQMPTLALVGDGEYEAEVGAGLLEDVELEFDERDRGETETERIVRLVQEAKQNGTF